MRGLYPILDLTSLTQRGVPVQDFAQQLLEAKPPLLQLRGKDASPRETLELLRWLRPLCRAAGTLLFANDRPDLALLAGCDGVHVGQLDLPVPEVRKLGSLLVGVSTHNAAELEAALANRPDYVAFGPVFGTRSKANPDPDVGLVALAEAAQRVHAAGLPLVAIGGITEHNASAVARHADLGAVIGALLPAVGTDEGVAERARRLHTALRGG